MLKTIKVEVNKHQLQGLKIYGSHKVLSYVRIELGAVGSRKNR